MATKEQLDFFRTLYEEEDARYEQIEGRARLYLGIITVFLASIILKSKEVKASAEALDVPWWLVVGEAVFLAGSLLLVVLGSLIRTYEGLTDPEKLIARYGDQLPANDEFLEDRIVDYAVATNRNSASNDRSAAYIQIAGVILAIAMFLMLGILVVALGS